jgi:hypothetical protein
MDGCLSIRDNNITVADDVSKRDQGIAEEHQENIKMGRWVWEFVNLPEEIGD